MVKILKPNIIILGCLLFSTIIVIPTAGAAQMFDSAPRVTSTTITTQKVFNATEILSENAVIMEADKTAIEKKKSLS